MSLASVFGRAPRRRSGIGRALAGLAAGAGIAYLVDPVRRARALERTRRAAREAERAVGARAHDAAEQARGAVRDARERGVRPWPDGATAVAVAVGSAAAARALLGRRLFGIPALLAGAALARGTAAGALQRSRRGRAPPLDRRHAQREASRRAKRAREEGRERVAHAGAWHPEPDPAATSAQRSSPAVEVKSPAELEAGIAHGSPEPTFPDRVTRRRGAARAPTTRRRRPGDDLPDPARAERVEPLPHAGFVAPPPGSGVRPGDLGAVPGPDELEAGDEDADDEG